MPQDNNNIPADESLVADIKNGNADSFKLLYFKYYPMLIRFALYRTHSLDMARETIQELFYRIWVKRHLLNPEKSIKAYLYKSLNNILINNKNLHSSKNISLSNLSPNLKNPVQADQELVIDIRDALEKLPEKIKTVYLLSRTEGLKYSDIAGICEISEKAVEKRMSKAISILRKIFSNKYFS